jgi:DNA primase
MYPNPKSNEDLFRDLRHGLFENEACVELLISRCISWGAVEKFALGYDSRPTSFMRERLAFPVRNAYGELVAWQGRAMSANIEPKYWHTGGDWKSYNLYGLFENGETIVRKGYAGMIESNFDMLSAYDAGIPCIATMGVALSEHQCILLRRYTEEVVVFAQRDKAGTHSSVKFVEQLSRFGIRAVIEQMPYPDTKDMNEIVVKKGLTSLIRLGYNYGK